MSTSLRLLILLLVTTIETSPLLFSYEFFPDETSFSRVLYISDVDGVMREDANGNLDLRVTELAKRILSTGKADAIFISGSPIEIPSYAEEWQRDNASLKSAFWIPFKDEITSENVKVIGAIGSQALSPDGKMRILDVYSNEQIEALCKLLLKAFLLQVQHEGTNTQKLLAYDLWDQIELLSIKERNEPTTLTPIAFKECVQFIRNRLDPEFRLICNGGDIGYQNDCRLWGRDIAVSWLETQLKLNEGPLSSLSTENKILASGETFRSPCDINWIKITKSHKGRAILPYVKASKDLDPKTFIIAFGDSQVDLPMYEVVDRGFHVGKDPDRDIPQMIVVRSEDGKDNTHIEGTIRVLTELLSLIEKN